MTTDDGPIFSVDTSAFIDGLERYYPEDAFPTLWQHVDDLIDAGRLVASEEVWEEIKTRDEVVKEWAEDRRDDLFVETDAAVALEVQEILVGHERLVMNLKNRNRADPFVIAVARLWDATVITGEGHDGSEKRPKIPYVCQEMDIECIRFTDLIQVEGWRF